MRLNKRFDIGWQFIVCGLVLTVAAIVLPAHQGLDDLESKQKIIIADLEDLEYQVSIHEIFLQDIKDGDSSFIQRLYELQFKIDPIGDAIVLDLAAPKTPLDWVANRARRTRSVNMETQQASILSKLSDGQGRLWLLGVGAFVLFIGLISNTTEELT